MNYTVSPKFLIRFHRALLEKVKYNFVDVMLIQRLTLFTNVDGTAKLQTELLCL